MNVISGQENCRKISVPNTPLHAKPQRRESSQYTTTQTQIKLPTPADLRTPRSKQKNTISNNNMDLDWELKQASGETTHRLDSAAITGMDTQKIFEI